MRNICPTTTLTSSIGWVLRRSHTMKPVSSRAAATKTRAREYVEPMAELDDVGTTLLDAAANLLATVGPRH